MFFFGSAACLTITVLLAILVAWFFIPAIYGLPWRPTDPHRIRRALELAGVRPGETVFDLGSGDGRILLLAASDFSAHGVGIEFSPILFLWSWLRVRSHPARGQVELHWGDCFRADLSRADVVVAYMTSSQATRLRASLERTARAGTRVTTLAFEIPGWAPDRFDPEALVYVYRMPASPGDLTTYLARAGTSRSAEYTS